MKYFSFQLYTPLDEIPAATVPEQKSKMAAQAGLKEVVSLYQTLIKEWNRKPVDLEKVGKLLSGMKVSKHSFLP